MLVTYEVVENIAALTLNHPERRNPLSSEMLTALKEQLDRVARDATVKAVILRAAGPVFSAGHDLKELAGGKQADFEALFALCSRVMETISNLPQPVIAQVQGVATAAGCQLVATCDLVIAAKEATFATPGVKIGLFCTTPGVALSRAVSTKKAFEMLFTGASITAEEAERVGLVNRVVAADKLVEETWKLARQIVSASTRTLSNGKRSFYQQLTMERPSAYTYAEKVMAENAATPDAREGIAAFLEKRKPKWND